MPPPNLLLHFFSGAGELGAGVYKIIYKYLFGGQLSKL